MPKNVRKLEKRTILEKPKRVAAYARVSCGKDAMLHSFSAQVCRFSELIQVHEGWQYAGVYADEALTGTKEDRADFQRLLSDCRAGLIDIVITKSVSRFARNTVTLLQTVRELKSLGVDVFFEEQNIHTMSVEGELMLTILASYAQEESLSASENQKWRIHKNFENGIPWNGTILGYRLKNGEFTIVPEEADIVRSIFTDYLSGMGTNAIMKKLNRTNSKTRFNNQWSKSGIMKILRNYTYTGNSLLQKTYRENHLTKKKCVNQGELPQYLATDTHEVVIPLKTYEAVQLEIVRRAKKYAPKQKQNTYPFSSLIECANCGKHYRRKTTAKCAVWVCSTYNYYGKSACKSKQIPEPILIATTLEVLETDSLDNLQSKILSIRAKSNNTLVYTLCDGETVIKHWQDRSRAESWTPEMRKATGEKTRERNIRNAKGNNDSGNEE